MNVLEQAAITALLSGAVITAVLNLVVLRRSTRSIEEIKNEYARQLSIFQSNRSWRERSVTELMAPVYMQLDRTKRAFERWTQQNLYLEAKVINEGNLAIRDLLLAKGHLVPPDLVNHAGEFVEHYDRWLKEFEKLRQAENPDLRTPFTFVRPKGFPFPFEAEKRFRERYRTMWQELYGE